MLLTTAGFVLMCGQLVGNSIPIQEVDISYNEIYRVSEEEGRGGNDYILMKDGRIISSCKREKRKEIVVDGIIYIRKDMCIE